VYMRGLGPSCSNAILNFTRWRDYD
jgi:hypothetical protein